MLGQKLWLTRPSVISGLTGDGVLDAADLTALALEISTAMVIRVNSDDLITADDIRILVSLISSGEFSAA